MIFTKHALSVVKHDVYLYACLELDMFLLYEVHEGANNIAVFKCRDAALIYAINHAERLHEKRVLERVFDSTTAQIWPDYVAKHKAASESSQSTCWPRLQQVKGSEVHVRPHWQTSIWSDKKTRWSLRLKSVDDFKTTYLFYLEEVTFIQDKLVEFD